ncbi:isochorismatase family protein [Porphyromonas sp. COT-239 OH1446]|uniref:isochorismatase family protein n=1 Tax=Porphyromonas sp. COT-239 OH1446 TaxID=1515613 RepID=UPI00052D25C8|nr:isochorismatase family protein [Porphyromonas sp. COT-239 OH1446]KGN68078.1 pyrazinamidase [Porphyromonas sp. COT-239 OH1446]
MNVLLIVDPQIDFISGSLAVPKAEEAMQFLADWIKGHASDYEAIVLTMDQHPANHCSFAHEGGPWPPHCVRYSVGAAIHPAVFEAVEAQRREGRPVLMIEKATTQERDSYSAFEKVIPSILLEAEHIYVAGIAGDYCVAASVEDLRREIPAERIELLEEAIAYIQRPER